MSKLTIPVNFPAKNGTIGTYHIELSRKIKVNQLIQTLRKILRLDHIVNINVCVEKKSGKTLDPVFYPEDSSMIIVVKPGDVIKLVCDKSNNDTM